MVLVFQLLSESSAGETRVKPVSLYSVNGDNEMRQSNVKCCNLYSVFSQIYQSTVQCNLSGLTRASEQVQVHRLY